MRSKAFSIDFVITIFRYFKLIISRYPSKKKNNNKWGFFFSDSFTNFAISN